MLIDKVLGVKNEEKVKYEEWKKKVNVNPEGFQFVIFCKKCRSNKVIVEEFDDIHQGYSEYTGPWGDAGVIIKCLKCGNAFTFKSVSI